MPKKFNFNKVVDLYREWNTDAWCEYLYNNIWVFIDSCKTIRVNPWDRPDIESEAILEAHNAILWSLDNSYWQIYNYVKTRVVWRIKNLYIKESNDLDRYYNEDIDNIDNIIELDIWNLLSKDVIFKFILEWILSLSEEERKIIYLRVFNYPWKTLKEIEKISWISWYILSWKYLDAIKKIRKHLENNWLSHEDLF